MKENVPDFFGVNSTRTGSFNGKALDFAAFVWLVVVREHLIGKQSEVATKSIAAVPPGIFPNDSIRIFLSDFVCKSLLQHDAYQFGCDFNHSARSMKLPSVTIRSPTLKPSITG